MAEQPARKAKDFSKHSSGQIAVMFALSLLAMLPVMGLIFDGGNLYVQRRTAQNAADAAGLAGTRALTRVPILSVNPTRVDAGSTVATAVCTYLTENSFGVTAEASTSTATFIDAVGQPFVGTNPGATSNIVLPTSPDPTAANPGHRKLNCASPNPALADPTIPTHVDPLDAALRVGPTGVQVNVTIGPFPTFLAGFLGRGIAGADGAGIGFGTTTAASTVQGAQVTAAFQANNTPFIICGINTRLALPAPQPTTHNILLMSGGVPVVPAQIDPTAVGMTFNVHGPGIAKCGMTDPWTGVANMYDNTGISTLPAVLATIGTNGSLTTQTAVDSQQGCAIVSESSATNCMMMLPIATTWAGVDEHFPCVLWAPFWIVKVGGTSHTAQLRVGSSVGVSRGPAATWTWGMAAPYTAIGLTR